MSKKETPEEEQAKNVTWMERRPIAGGHFGAVPYEYQIVSGTEVPPGGIQVADDTPVCGWTPGRQYLPGGELVGFDATGAAAAVSSEAVEPGRMRGA